jgi:hypothetical protein
MSDREMEIDSERTSLIFTRYLYSKEDVFHSLFISVLDKKPEEALFWACPPTFQVRWWG